MKKFVLFWFLFGLSAGSALSAHRNDPLDGANNNRGGSSVLLSSSDSDEIEREVYGIESEQDSSLSSPSINNAMLEVVLDLLVQQKAAGGRLDAGDARELFAGVSSMRADGSLSVSALSCWSSVISSLTSGRGPDEELSRKLFGVVASCEVLDSLNALAAEHVRRRTELLDGIAAFLAGDSDPGAGV